MKAECQSQSDREEARLRKLYKEKAQEEMFSMQQRQEETMDKKLGYKRELRERRMAEIMQERARIELEL